MRKGRSKPDRAAEAKLAELVRQGLLTPARNRTPGPPPSIPIAPLEEILRELDESREDR